jgi:hypothetical protein
MNHHVLVKYMSEIGHIYTTADKIANEYVSWKKVTQVSFLKRRFSCGDDGRWKARLELKSLVKMLVCCKRSDLSLMDHAAVLLTNVNSELYFHGKSIFDQWMLLIEESARKFELDKSILLRLKSFGELHDLYLKDEYPTWIVGDRSALFRMQGCTNCEEVYRRINPLLDETLLVPEMMYIEYDDEGAFYAFDSGGWAGVSATEVPAAADNTEEHQAIIEGCLGYFYCTLWIVILECARDF